MSRKTISLMIVSIMIISLVNPLHAFGASNDYTGHWAEETIQLWLDKGYIAGYPYGTFKPEGLVTRAEFVKMVNSIFDYKEIADIKFIDVKSDDWYYQDVQKAVKAGYISGVSQMQFAPKDNLTREQAAVIISRIMNIEGNSIDTEVFSDSNKISSWARNGVGAAAVADFIKGYKEDNTFKPQNPIKRAEAVVLLNNVLESSKTEEIPETETPLGGGVSGGGSGGGGSGNGPEEPIYEAPVELTWDLTDTSITAIIGQLEETRITAKLSNELLSINALLVIEVSSEVGIEEGNVVFNTIEGIAQNIAIDENKSIIKFTSSEITITNETIIDVKFKFNKTGTYNMKVYLIESE